MANYRSIMILLIQRVLRAEVRVDGAVRGQAKAGLLILGCVEPDDDESRVDTAARKAAELRIFEDSNGRMNLSCLDVTGEVLAVSQFTLGADLSRGRRPGFEGAARPERAEPLFKRFVENLRAQGLHVETGVFGATMQVELVNDGPATFWWRTPRP